MIVGLCPLRSTGVLAAFFSTVLFLITHKPPRQKIEVTSRLRRPKHALRRGHLTGQTLRR
jgi:hypothetical protein